jgi:hypothetical protein
MKFVIDGDEKSPTINGTGTEDYFGGAWGFGDKSEAFSALYSGYPLYRNEPGQIPNTHSIGGMSSTRSASGRICM